MKKMALGVSMILACLIFLVPPATAAHVSHGAPALNVFLASLAGPAPVSAAKHPAIAGKSSCTASATCGDGSTIGCSGNNTCSSADTNCPEQGHVTCDGGTTWCPGTCINCGILEQQCAWSCNPCYSNFTCDPSTGEWDCGCIMEGCPQ